MGFASAFKQAEAELTDSLRGHIQDAAASGPKHWPAAMTLLERRVEGFSRNQKVESSVEVTVTHQLTMPDVAMNQLLEIVQTRLQQKLLTEQITVDADEPT